MENLNENARKDARIEIGLSVSERIQLVSVVLIEGSFRRNRGIEGAETEIRQRRSIETQVDEAGSQLQVATRLVLNAFPANSESENSFIDIEARFLLIYVVSSMDGLAKEHFDSFAEFNGIFNVWPYWREFVQSATVRMGLPALTVPVYRIGGKRPSGPIAAQVKVGSPLKIGEAVEGQ